MKKTLLVLLLVLATLVSCACGGGDKKDDSKSPSDLQSADENSTLTESGVGDGAVNDTTSTPDSSATDDSSAPEIIPEYFDIYGWQDGMYFGSAGQGDDYYYGVIDSKGKLLFKLEKDVYFATKIKGESRVFFGDYALLDNNTVINRKGEVVFDLAKTEFNAIYYSECLDIGYVLCSKDINTFEETGKHYYAVKIGGETFKFEEEMKPMSVHHTYYFGNGIFLHSPANSGFGTKHTFYNLKTKEIYQGYKLDADGEQVYEYLPDLYFYGGFNKDITTKPTTNGHFYAKSSETIVDYELATGYCNIIEIKDILGVDSVSSDKDTKTAYITKMKYSGESYNSEKFMLNVLTSEYILMNDYADYEIYAYKAGTGYLAQVTNSGGGKFVTVIKEDGTRAFDPIAAKVINYFGNNLFIITGDDGKLALYNWKGEMLKAWEGKLNRVIMGENSVMVVTMLDSTLTSLLYTADGKEINITAMEKLADVKTTQPEAFSGGCFVYENVLVNEKGEAVTTRTN